MNSRAFCFLILLMTRLAGPAADFSPWHSRQELPVPQAGWVKLPLPPETLAAALPGLDDLRVTDPAGTETGYWIERVQPDAALTRGARSFQPELRAGETLLLVETGFDQPIRGVTLITPAVSFIKPARVEGSIDGRNWVLLARDVPVFRQPAGAEGLLVGWSPARFTQLRITLDDRRSVPIPFTGVSIHAAEAGPAPVEALTPVIVSREESVGETRLLLDLGAAQLPLARLAIETPETLFTRPARLATRELDGNVVRERVLASGVFYRVALEGQPAATRLELPVETQIPGRQALLIIQNGDSPALQLTTVRATRRPVYLVFSATQAGTYALLTGNPRAPAPRYDLASFPAQLKQLPVTTLKPGSLAPNPAFRAPEALPGIDGLGAALDVAAWTRRKAVSAGASGVQEIELDIETLAAARSDFSDLRLVSGNRQIPYVVEPARVSRAIVPQVTEANDPKQPKVSRWSLKLPQAGLPLLQLSCQTRSPLFRREMTLYEERADQMGQEYRRVLGQASWVQTPERGTNGFSVSLTTAPAGDQFYLETNNEDNPAIILTGFEFWYPVTRLVFKRPGPEPVHLYFGHREVSAPSYDLSLVATSLLEATRVKAVLGALEILKPGADKPGLSGEQTSWLFWGVLILVVAGLLVVITRLLPKPAPPSA